MIRIVICDQHPLLRSGLAAILPREPDLRVIGEVGCSVDAVTRVRDLRPDVAVVAMSPPPSQALRFTRAIAGRDAPVRVAVLMLGTAEHEERVGEMVAAGALGFLRSDSSVHRLSEAIRTIDAGGGALSPAVTGRLLRWLADRLPPDLGSAQDGPTLSDRERQVLRLLGDGSSSRDIGRALSITDATVRSHVHHILTKMNARDRTQAVVRAYRSGLLH